MAAEVVVGLPREEGKVTVFALGEAAPVAATDLVADAPERFVLRDRQRLEHDLVYKGEDGGGGADTEGEGDDGRRGESGRLA